MAEGLKLLLLLGVVSGVAVRGNEFVNFMSIQMMAAEQLYDLPKLPALASELGLKALVDSVVEAGLAKTLSGEGPFTVFGPTNQAFQEIPKWLKKELINKTILADVLKYHVLSGKVLSSAIKNELLVDTVQGKPIRFNCYPDCDSPKKITAQCAVIDLKRVDQMASNGVIHVLESVMLPPYGNIVEAAVGCPAFSTLVTAVKAADPMVLKTLSSEGNFTLFAPTDAAFSKIPKDELEKLLKNPKALTDVLTYHVATKTYCSAGLVSGESLQMANGQKVTINIDGKTVKVNDATVIPLGADGSVTNGVVHAIDTVLMPPSLRL